MCPSQNNDYYQSESDLSDDGDDGAYASPKKSKSRGSKKASRSVSASNQGYYYQTTANVEPDSSASEYGAPSAKKKRKRDANQVYGSDSPANFYYPSDLARVSTRGGKVPNYNDETRFGSEEDEDEDEAYGSGAQRGAIGPNGVPVFGVGETFEEQDEIEGVYGHFRDEERST